MTAAMKHALERAALKASHRRFTDEPITAMGDLQGCADPYRTDEDMAEALEDGPGYHFAEMCWKDGDQ